LKKERERNHIGQTIHERAARTSESSKPSHTKKTARTKRQVMEEEAVFTSMTRGKRRRRRIWE